MDWRKGGVWLMVWGGRVLTQQKYLLSYTMESCCSASFPPTVRSLSGSPLPAEWGTAARVHFGSGGCPKPSAGLCSCVLKHVRACLVYPTLLTGLNKHRCECLDCMGARALGPQCAGSKQLMGVDVTDVYFCVHRTPAFQSYPLANLAVGASSEALFFRP